MVYIERKAAAPPSLAKEKQKRSSKKYNAENVFETLFVEFHQKCYICECRSTSLNTEHFIPHRGDRDLMFDWYNLFLSCAHCNNEKNRAEEYNYILNCTDILYKDFIEKDIECRISCGKKNAIKESISITTHSTDTQTLNTASLLNAVFVGTTPVKKGEATNLCQILCQEMSELSLYVNEYLDCLQNNETQRLKELEADIYESLHRSSPFAAFKRQWVKDSPKLVELFGHFL